MNESRTSERQRSARLTCPCEKNRETDLGQLWERKKSLRMLQTEQQTCKKWSDVGSRVFSMCSGDQKKNRFKVQDKDLD